MPLLENELVERLQYLRAVLAQLQDTCLCNAMLDKAVEDADYLLSRFSETKQNESR